MIPSESTRTAILAVRSRRRNGAVTQTTIAASSGSARLGSRSSAAMQTRPHEPRRRVFDERPWRMLAMTDFPYRAALIVGVGPGISASLARRLTALGVKVALAARDTAKLAELIAETGAATIAADATQPASVAALFEAAESRIGEPDI